LKEKEKELLRIIRNGGRLKTVDIVRMSNMCKVTVLKYLNQLKVKGRVNYELIGPTKLWYLVEQDDGGSGGRRPSSSAEMEISELLKGFESVIGNRAVVIMASEDFISILRQEKSVNVLG
jgi:hypothetical protein